MDDIHAQITRLQAVIAQQEAEAAQLEAEVLLLERELDDFAALYERVVGTARAKLDAARAAIDELERRRYLEQYADLPPPEPDRPLGFIPVAEQYRRVWLDPPPVEPPPPSADKPRESPFADDPATRLKRLYRALARRYHPDLAKNPADRDYRTRLMVLINEAYEGRDLEALQLLAEQPGTASPDLPVAALRLRRLQQTSAALQQRIDDLRAEQSRLIHSDWMRLKTEAALARRKGRDLLRDLADELEREYATAMMLLQRLRQR
ncbi:MAG: J domain-containing protein [Chloroflexi bacterium]|nr:J domain-containing protein [Chloroflexota bacterium]